MSWSGLSATTTSTACSTKVTDMCSSVRTIASLSFHAADDGHRWPVGSAPVALGGWSQRSWYPHDQG